MDRITPALILVFPLLAASSIPAAAEAFNGFFAGLQGGYETSQDTSTSWEVLRSGPIGGPNQTSRGGDGIAYGLFVGYDWLFTQRFFVGLEGAMIGSTSDFTYTDLDASDTPIEGQGAKASIKSVTSAAVRLGMKISDTVGVYGRIGVASTKVSLKSLPEADGFTLHANQGGVELGGGAQFALGDRLFSRVQYTYTDIESGYVNPIKNSHRVMIGMGVSF